MVAKIANLQQKYMRKAGPILWTPRGFAHAFMLFDWIVFLARSVFCCCDRDNSVRSSRGMRNK